MKTGNGRVALAVMLALVLTALMPVITADTDDSYGADDGSSDYYYGQLGAKAKVVYDKVLAKAESLDPADCKIEFVESDFPGNKYPTVADGTKAFYAFYYDHPEIFWVTNGFGYEYVGDSMTSITLNCTAGNAADLAEQKAAVESAVGKITIDGEFTYDKVKQIHNWIVENCSYNSEAVGDEEAVEAHNIYGIFVQKTAVCEGYARAFMYLCQMNDIDTIVSIGDGISKSGSEAHMWNYIKMEDDVWYCMDVTWDDPLVNGSDSGKVYYNYFLKGTESEYNDYAFTESHADNISKYSLEIPELSEEAYRFQPDGTEFITGILCEKNASGDLSDSYTMQVADISTIREDIGSGGEVLVRTASFQFRISCADLKTIEDTLTAASITEVTFGGTVQTEEIKVWTQYDFLESVSFLYDQTKEVKTYTPTISTGDISSLGLDEMEIGIAAEFQQLDLSFFLTAWDVSDPELPKTVKSTYDDGYQCVTVSSIGTYCPGNNPLSPGLDVPFLYIIGVLALIVVVILLFIRHLIKGRSIKKLAKGMARSRKNMQHYGKLYEEGELSRKERKAYRKALKIAAKNGNSE